MSDKIVWNKEIFDFKTKIIKYSLSINIQTIITPHYHKTICNPFPDQKSSFNKYVTNVMFILIDIQIFYWSNICLLIVSE